MQIKLSTCVLNEKKPSLLWGVSIWNQSTSFTYFISSVSSTENNVNIRLAKAWLTIDKLSIIWKSDLFDKTEQDFF